MTISQEEAVASLKILVAVANADSEITAEEKEGLKEAFAKADLPKDISVADILQADIDLETELARIKSEEARKQTYLAAFFMAHADADCSPKEQAALDTIRSGLDIGEKQTSLMKRFTDEVKDTFVPGSIKKIDDPQKRAAEIDEDVMKYSILAGVMGAFPVPLLDIPVNLAITGLQLKMISDIGMYHGYTISRKDAKAVLAGVAGSTGLRILATSALKFVPIVGSLAGAAAGFATTYALAEVADQYCVDGCKADLDKLKKKYKEARAKGEELYKEHKDQVEAKRAAHTDAIKELNSQLKDGKITREEYEQQLAALR